MAWIESHTVLLRHRKVLQVSNDLSISPVYVVGHLHALWHTILEQQEDGDLTEWPDAMIAQAASYDGDANMFVSVLQSRKWLDGKIVHDWMDYAGRYLVVKYRTSNPKRLLQIQKLHHAVRKTVYSRSKVGPKTDNLTRPNLPNQTGPNPTDITKPTDKNCGEDKPSPPPAKSDATWAAYSTAYEKRWKAKPPRHAKVNSLLCQVVDALGAESAPLVAEFYVSHNDLLYVRSRHALNLLVRDADSLHTQWITGVKATHSEAKSAGQQDDAREQVKRVEAMLRKGPL